ncbi:hypothetical protein HORIV_57660 [Vreelandella olivaria]|uniref:Uncharacterized protein n=1 Tax=Vreelandella olivaria TaxID=390919 RepID=A0ABN5X8P6_9GAMM|nr:hypothetical protein HORIV_57660 [Halomonas olivaria]
MVDKFGNPAAFQENVDIEMQRNRERYEFLRWGQQAFDNFSVVPPAPAFATRSTWSTWAERYGPRTKTVRPLPTRIPSSALTPTPP